MGTYIMLSSLFLPLHPTFSLDASSDDMTRIWIALVGIAAPVLVMWSRVQLGVHTPAQTLVGAALGVAKAYIWFTAWNGTTLVFGPSLAFEQAGSARSVLQDGLRNSLGVRIDSIIGQTEARLLGSI